jgi:co-chaperonin GroES (HSP10)
VGGLDAPTPAWPTVPAIHAAAYPVSAYSGNPNGGTPRFGVARPGAPLPLPNRGRHADPAPAESRAAAFLAQPAPRLGRHAAQLPTPPAQPQPAHWSVPLSSVPRQPAAAPDPSPPHPENPAADAAAIARAEAAARAPQPGPAPNAAPAPDCDDDIVRQVPKFRPVPSPAEPRKAARTAEPVAEPRLWLRPLPPPQSRSRRGALAEVVEHPAFLARKSMRPLTAAAAAAVAATLLYSSVHTAAPGAEAETEAAPEVNALTPLRDAIELAAKRDVAEQASRSGFNRQDSDAEAADAALKVAKRSDAAIKLTWDAPELADGDRVVVRRMAGTEYAATVKDGDAVPVDPDKAGVALDQGLVPGEKYSYTVFVQRKDLKPEIIATARAKTRLHPIELAAGDSLVAGEKMVSESGDYSLELEEDGNLVLRNSRGLAMWTPSVQPVEGSSLVMGTSGRLKLASEVETLWSPRSKANPGSVLRVTDRGDVQLVNGKTILWHRGKTGDVSLGDDYPFRGGSPLGYAPDNCTDFAAWRLNKYAGVTGSPWRFTRSTMTPRGGNAVQWAGYYPDQTDQDPALGAVAWWGSSTGRGYGHVAIVTAVRPDGSITIEEYNYLNRHSFGRRSFEPGSADWPEAFIHINDL